MGEFVLGYVCKECGGCVCVDGLVENVVGEFVLGGEFVWGK